MRGFARFGLWLALAWVLEVALLVIGVNATSCPSW